MLILALIWRWWFYLVYWLCLLKIENRSKLALDCLWVVSNLILYIVRLTLFLYLELTSWVWDDYSFQMINHSLMIADLLRVNSVNWFLRSWCKLLIWLSFFIYVIMISYHWIVSSESAVENQSCDSRRMSIFHQW